MTVIVDNELLKDEEFKKDVNKVFDCVDNETNLDRVKSKSKVINFKFSVT